MNLTTSEIAFVERHGIGVLGVLDGRELKQKEYHALAVEQGKTLVLGTPCGKKLHRLRTRSGHCAECHPKKIAFQNRYSSEQFVYIAGSKKGKLIKIGTTNDTDERQHRLRVEAYGGFKDWTMLYSALVKDAGRVEQRVRWGLEGSRIIRQYDKEGQTTEASELFNCSFSRAEMMLVSIDAEYAFKGRLIGNLDDYEFGVKRGE